MQVFEILIDNAKNEIANQTIINRLAHNWGNKTGIYLDLFIHPFIHQILNKSFFIIYF